MTIVAHPAGDITEMALSWGRDLSAANLSPLLGRGMQEGDVMARPAGQAAR